MSKSRAHYTAQFKQQILELLTTGRSPRDLAKEFSCHYTTIHAWQTEAKLSKAGLLTPAQQAFQQPLSNLEREELIALRRKLRQVEQERDILAKATAWFARKNEPTYIASTDS